MRQGSPGIRRFVVEMLGRWFRYCESDFTLSQKQWFCYGAGADTRIGSLRHSKNFVALYRKSQFPVAFSRVASPIIESSYWLFKDRPAHYWGPAHRLPAILPEGTRSIVTIHDVCWKRYPNTMRALSYAADAVFMPLALSRADVIVAVSRATAEDIAYYWPAVQSRIRVVPLGVNEEWFSIPNAGSRSEKALGHGRFFLSVGTIEPRKNLGRVLKAYASLALRNKLFPSLVIVGKKGWKSDSPLVMARELGVADRVCWLQSADDDQLKQLYRQAVALVFPSLYEGFGLPVLEAMAAGTPVITSNCASLPEVAGDAALLVDPLRLDQIREAMQALASDDLLRARLGSRGRERAKQFSWDSTASQMLEVFSGR
jgi:glycosyltransferase involved in cell wall biosynthesis